MYRQRIFYFLPFGSSPPNLDFLRQNQYMQGNFFPSYFPRMTGNSTVYMLLFLASVSNKLRLAVFNGSTFSPLLTRVRSCLIYDLQVLLSYTLRYL